MAPPISKPRPPIAAEEEVEEGPFAESDETTAIGLDPTGKTSEEEVPDEDDEAEPEPGDEGATVLGLDAPGLPQAEAASEEPQGEAEEPAEESADEAEEPEPSLEDASTRLGISLQPPPPASRPQETRRPFPPEPGEEEATAPKPALPWDEAEAAEESDPPSGEGETAYGVDADSLAGRLAEAARKQREAEAVDGDEEPEEPGEDGATAFGVDAATLAARLAARSQHALGEDAEVTNPSAAPADEDGEPPDPNATRTKIVDLQAALPARPGGPGSSNRHRPAPSRQPPGRRPLAGEEDEATAVKPPGISKRRLLLIPLAALGAVALALAAGHFLGSFKGERVSVEQLRLLYPYGPKGMRGPRGEQAPGAAEMGYHFVETVACSTHAECLRYRYALAGFSGTMVIGRRGDGRWERVSDDGLPFPIQPAEK